MPEAHSAPFPPNPVSRDPRIIPSEPGQKPKLLDLLRWGTRRTANLRVPLDGNMSPRPSLFLCN